jgi:hypothetical protein
MIEFYAALEILCAFETTWIPKYLVAGRQIGTALDS